MSWASSLGIAGQSVALNLATAPGGVTQYAASSTVQSTTNNGVNFGNLAGVSVDGQGFVTATYDNGVIRKIAQVAIATFPNADGLKSITGGRLPGLARKRRLWPEVGRAGRSGKDRLVHARKLDCRSFDGIYRTDHNAASLLGIVQDHHYDRPDVAGTDRHQALILTQVKRR